MLVPARFLVRLAYRCPYLAAMPRENDDALLDLPDKCRIDNFAALDGKRNFADVRLAWNELGIGLQVTVRGKEQPVQGHVDRPRASDGVTLWLDLRDARTSHRASRFCFQFNFLPTGGGSDNDEPVVVQSKINRALQDAPLASAGAIPFVCDLRKGGYQIAAFLPVAVLAGYDPEQFPRLGVFYSVRDQELGEQTLGLSTEFPFWEDPTLWSVLDVVRETTATAKARPVRPAEEEET